MSVWNNRFPKNDKIMTFFSLGWLQKMSVGRWALRARCRGNITAVSWCVFIVTLIPQGKAPFTSAMPAASLWQEVLKHTVHFTKEIQKAQVWVRIKIYVMLYTHTQSPPAAGAGLSTASPVHLGIASSFAVLISFTPKDKETRCTTGRHLSPQEQLLETFHCQKISSQFFLPIFLSLYLPSPSVLLSCSAPFPSLLLNVSLRGSSSAMLQVRLSLAQALFCRSLQRWRGTVFYVLLNFLFITLSCF